VLSQAPDPWLLFQILRIIYYLKGMQDEALQATRSLYSTLGDSAVLMALDQGFEEGGYKSAMAQAADEPAREAKTRFVLPSQIAVLYGMADDVEKAVVWLEKAFEERDPEMPHHNYLPRFSVAVANHPKTLATIEAMKYPSMD